MTINAHNLADQFPADAALLRSLQGSDLRLQHLADRYAMLDRDIRDIEATKASIDDLHLESLKKARLGILDEIASAIASVRVEQVESLT